MSYHPILFAALSSLTLPFENGTPLALVLFVVYFGLLLLPGFATAGLIVCNRRSGTILPVVLTVVTSAVYGLLAFWAFFFSKTLGRWYCFAVYLASVAVLVRLSRHSGTLRSLLAAVRKPFLYTAGTGLIYTALLFFPSRSVASNGEYPALRFFAEGRPGDNLIPLFLADRLYDQRPIRPFCCGDWLSSDRPPLQGGVFLLQRPLRLLGGNWLHYQLLATSLQCLWVCGVWCMLLSLGTTEARIRQVLVFLIVSGFLFYNSVYTWPKLFASALVLFTISVLAGSLREKRAATRLEVLAASASFGLTLLTHPGSVFSLPAFAMLGFRYRRWIRIRQLALAASVVLCFALPWSAYQRYVDPPGDRLLKLHLAGETDLTPRSTFQVVHDAYRSHTAGDILRFKLSNLALLLGRSPFDLIGLNAVQFRPALHFDYAAAEQSRIAQREYIWNAFGVLNIGWGIALVLALRRKFDSAVPFGPWLVLAGSLNLFVWSMVMFGPGATVTTHCSYADILLLCIGLLGWILTLPRYVVGIVFVIQAFNFAIVWVWPR